MHKAFSTLFIASLIFISGCQHSADNEQPQMDIIPQPKDISFSEGKFEITSETKLVYKGLDKKVVQTINSFSHRLNQSTGFELELTAEVPVKNYISFELVEDYYTHEEGYELLVNPNSVQVKAPTPKGLFYATQTLRQLLPPNFEAQTVQENTNWSIPSLHINDYPQFPCRALNMDVARHYFPVEFIKKQLDLLALYKINVFQWHLTDDQGWRIEIKKYPKLTSVGARRAMTLLGHGANPPFKYDEEPYSGFYTQDEIKEVINYASERHITVVPEIELPGHSLAALAAYPQLGCTGGPYEVATRWGVFDDVFCAGKESTYQIIEDILTEVAQLFPGDYIHIGGDECTKTRWRNCSHCQSLMKSNGLLNETELENYFIRRVQAIVKKLSKKMAGWNEIMTDSTLTDATIVLWQDDTNFKEAIRNNNQIIKASNNYLYFDHYQASPQNHPLAIGGYTPLVDVYHYKPLSDNLSTTEQQSIIGVLANCWTEYIPTEDKFEFMLYPRLCAFSEVAWGDENQKDWPAFRCKVENHLQRLNYLGVNYYYEVPKPVPNKSNLNFTQPTTLSFKQISENYSIRYTTDGSEPDATSKLYTQAIPVNSFGTIKAITINKLTGEQSKTEIFNLNRLEFQKPVSQSDLQPGLNCAVYRGRFKTVKEIKNTNMDTKIIVHESFIPDSVYRESFGLILSGFFKAEQKGIYEFELNSDDGSALYIGNEIVVNNDGIHGSKEEKGAIALRKGFYPVTIYYFQTTGYSNCNLNVRNPDKTNQKLKPDDFYY